MSRGSRLAAILAGLKPAAPGTHRLLSSATTQSGFAGSIRSFAADGTLESTLAAECTPMSGSGLAPISHAPASQPLGSGVHRPARFQGAGVRPGFRVGQRQHQPRVSLAQPISVMHARLQAQQKPITDVSCTIGTHNLCFASLQPGLWRLFMCSV